MKVRLKQNATYEGDHRWKWSVWVEGEKEDLGKIRYVEYTLHPSFPDPIRRIEDRSSKFRLDSAGWGEFTIRALVVKKDGEKKTLRHRVELEYPAEQEGQSQPAEQVKGASAEELHEVFFLSCNIADSLLANALSKALIARGARVLMVADEPSDLPWDASIERLLDQADFAVFIISDALSIWMKRDIEATTEQGVPIIPVIIGSSRVDSSELSSTMRKAIKIKPVPAERFDDEAQGIADRIQHAVKSIPAGATKKETPKQ